MSSLDSVDLLRRLIRCRSVTPEDGGALGVLEDVLKPMGFHVERLIFSTPGTADIPNLFARLGGGSPHFCFAGHTDVVPAGNDASWTSGPFEGAIRDGSIIGRGAVDMKGGVAAFIAAVSRFLETKRQDFTGSISLLITGDEEGEAVNGTRRVVEWLQAQGIALDACLVGEPTSAEVLGDMVKIGRRGSLNGTLLVHGVGGHTAYPHLADNPAHRLVAMLADLTGRPLDAATEHFQASSLQISSIDIGNPASNVIPANACARFNVRFNDGWTGRTLEQALRDRLAAFGGRWELSITVSGEAFLTPTGKFAAVIGDSIEAVTGRRPIYSTSGGTSDARFIKDLGPVAEFGPVGKTMHQVDERLDVAELQALTRIYHEMLCRMFAGAG